MKINILNSALNYPECYESIISPRNIKFLVLHHICANSLIHALDQLFEHKVSAHYIIDEVGNINQMVDEKDIAYHAGVSNWQGIEGLNKYSIGVEFISSDPFVNGFNENQMLSAVKLCSYLIKKYHILPRNIVGHSDIAYDKNTLLLDRKQDPSHLFNWKFLAENKIGIFPEISLN